MDSNPWSDDTKNIKPLELPELDSSAWRDDGQSNTRNKRDDTVIPTQGAGFQEISLNEMESAKSLSNPLNNSHKLMNIPLSNDKSASCSNLNTKSMELKEDGKHVRNYSQEDLEEKLHQGFSKGLKSLTDENGMIITNKSQTLSNIQNVFTDSQKIAYVGLCYLAMNEAKNRLKDRKNAFDNCEKWIQIFMEKLYIYLDLTPEERLMIESLVEHGLQSSDLSVTLIDDAKVAAEKHQSDADKSSEMDIRFTILSHLFLISLCDGYYDSRSRNLLRVVASNLQIPYEDLVTLEGYIANTLRIYEEDLEVKHNNEVIEIRNQREGTNRWIYAGAATLAGGAIIGLTAGLAAPFIGAGVGAALTTFGMTGSGVAGIGAFLSGTGGLALITSGGVLTGGGMSGLKMMKRTGGIEEFEFLGLADALALITQNKEKRQLERQKKGKSDTKQEEIEIQKEINENIESDAINVTSSKVPINDETGDILWEISADIDEKFNSPDKKTDVLGSWADMGSKEELGDQSETVPKLESTIKDPIPLKSRQTNVLITVAGWVSYDKDDHTYPYSTLTNGRNGDQYSLIWETKILVELWTSMAIFAREVATFIVQQGIQVTLLPVLLGALTGPMWLIKLTYLLDNPWGNALSKAQKAGRLLADTLIGQVQSHRPVTLVGFSIGARLIYNCLLELADKDAYGIIDNVYLLGTPVVTSEKELKKITSVVSGTIYNGYNPNDTVLNVLYRATTTSYSYVFGLAPQNHPGIQNVNLSEMIGGHLEYGTKVPIILKHFGFEVDADTFEDQDAEIMRYQTEEEKLKQQQKEQEMQEKLNRQLQQEEERLAELEKKRAAKIKAAEQKRLLKEADMAMKKRKEIEMKRRKEIEASRKINSALSSQKTVAADDLATEELMHMQQVQQMMNEYWSPRELESTLPPLVIDSTKLNSNESLAVSNEDAQIESGKPPLGKEAAVAVNGESESSDLKMARKIPSSQGFYSADEGEMSDF